MPIFERPKKYIDAVAITGDYTSQLLEVGPITRLGLGLSWTGFTGTITFLVSIDGTNYPTLKNEGVAVSIVAAGDGSDYADIDVSIFDKIKIFVDVTSGTGTLTVYRQFFKET